MRNIKPKFNSYQTNKTVSYLLYFISEVLISLYIDIIKHTVSLYD